MGGGLQALSYDAATSSTEILPATWTEEGWNLAVNGVPVTSMNRAVRPGDLLQPYHGNQPYPVVPQGFILGLCPQLAVLAWPAWIREGGLPMTTFETLFPRFVELSRSRRVTMGAFYRDAGFAAVLGPVHGTIHLHFPNGVANHPRGCGWLTMLDHPPPWADVLKAAVLWPETSLFTTSSQDVAGQTVLIPAPAYAEQHLVIVVPPQSGLVDGLPGEANAQLFPRRSLNSGDVLYLQRDPGRMPEPDTDIEEEFAVLLQTRVRRIASTRQASGATIPTPFGRRLLLPDSAGSKGTRMAPGPLDSVDRRICLDRAIPAANSRRLAGRAYMHLGATADAFADVFADFSLACLQSQRPKGDGLPPKIQSFLQSLPLLADRMPQALQIYVDGSFFPATASSSARAGWALVVLALCDTELAGSTSTLGQEVASSFEVELAALAYALAISVRMQLPCLIGHDSQAAGDIAFGAAFDSTQGALSQACLAMVHFLRQVGREPCKVHIPSHTGHVLNDLADALARGATEDGVPCGLSPALAEAHDSGVLAWLWATCGLHHSVPWAGEQGTTAQVPRSPGRTLSHSLPDHHAAASCEAQLSFKAATYNCLSLQGVEQSESIDFQFQQAGFALIAFQETRTQRGRRSSTQHYHVFASEPV